MNNDSASTPAADLLPLSSNTSNDASLPVEAAPRAQNVQPPAQKRLQTQTRKKHDFISDLMLKLDGIIYMELCILYYMDCSLFRFLLRVFCQMVFLTPKPALIPPIPQHRPYVYVLFGSNIICTLLHILTARPEAGEALRGYLHGGVIVDLIGQKGPTSKLHLVLLDLVVLALQCFMLAVHMERERLVVLLGAISSPGAEATVSSQPRAEAPSAQNIDAEERGVMRDEVTNNGNGIELRSMATQNRDSSATGNGDNGVRNEERERLLAEPPPQQDEEDEPLDIFYSGEVVLAEFHILHTLRKQWDDYGKATASALPNAGFNAEFSALSENRRLVAATQRLQREMESVGS